MTQEGCLKTGVGSSARLGRSKTRYQNVSRALVRARHPTWSEAQIEATAASEWNAAARALWGGTLRLSRQMRPRARWGFYNFPTGAVDAGQERWNTALGWLWKDSTALFPSLYYGVVHGGPTYGRFPGGPPVRRIKLYTVCILQGGVAGNACSGEAVRNITAETVRLASIHCDNSTEQPKQTWPFVWYLLQLISLDLTVLYSTYVADRCPRRRL